jgi:malonate-semialdehyde dehydrogenase (acetylating) / methylmalonate-semialdehyde dehydrogenase
MAASVLIAVGRGPAIERILDTVVEEARTLRPGCELGALISAAARERIVGYIDRAEAHGARVLLDGRHPFEGDDEDEEEHDLMGFYLGPTILENVTPHDECLRDEIFGPVLSVIRVDTLDEALAIENRSPFGNAASIFTSDGATATYFEQRANAGMVGINIGVPVPRDPFPFGGWNASKFGAGDITGEEGIAFWTRLKKVTRKWSAPQRDWMS